MLLCLFRSQPLALRPCCTAPIVHFVLNQVWLGVCTNQPASTILHRRWSRPMELRLVNEGEPQFQRRWGTEVGMQVWNRFKKLNRLIKKKNESDDVLCTTLTLTPRYKFVIFSVFLLNSLSLSFTYGLCWAMALLESLSDMSLSHRLTSHWLTASLPPATPPVTPCLHSPSLTLPF